jgi:hypothetical protein
MNNVLFGWNFYEGEWANSSKIELISFLCPSLGSSTIQLHDNLGSRSACPCSKTGFSSQNGGHVGGVYYRRAVSYCAFFCGEKGLNAKDIHSEMFAVYGEKCLSRKAVHDWLTRVLLMIKRLKRTSESGSHDSQKLLCYVFRRRTGKAKGELLSVLVEDMQKK